MAINRYRYYVGPLGALQALPAMVGGSNAPEAPIRIPGGLHTSLSGRTTLDRVGIPKRSWALSWENLRETDRLLIDAIIHRTVRSPLRLIDPRSSNRLSALASAGGSQLASTAAFTSQGSIYDFFTRSVSNDWSNLTSGHSWQEDLTGAAGGTINDYDVGGSTGTIAIQANGQSYYAVVSGQIVLDSDQRLDFTVPFTDVTGASLEVGGLVARWRDSSNHYLARVITATNETFTLEIYRIGGTGGTALLAGPVAVSGAHVGGTFLTIRMQVAGTIIRAKAWPAASAQPAGWQATATDMGLIGAGQIGIRTSVAAGNTNAKPVLATFDNYRATVSPTASAVLSYANGLVPSALADYVSGGLQWNPPFSGCLLLATDEQVPILAGSSYELSCYVSGNVNVKLAALPFDLAGAEQQVVTSSAVSVTGVMQRFTWVYTPAAGVVAANFGLEAQGAGSIQTSGWQVVIDQTGTSWSHGVGCPAVVVDPEVPISYWRTKYHRIRLVLRES